MKFSLMQDYPWVFETIKQAFWTKEWIELTSMKNNET